MDEEPPKADPSAMEDGESKNNASEDKPQDTLNVETEAAAEGTATLGTTAEDTAAEGTTTEIPTAADQEKEAVVSSAGDQVSDGEVTAVSSEDASSPTAKEVEAATSNTEPASTETDAPPKQLTEKECIHERYDRKSLLITSIFSVMCFFPLGILALYYGIKVQNAPHALHKEYAKRSYFWSVASITTGSIALVLILIVLILGISGVIQ